MISRDIINAYRQNNIVPASSYREWILFDTNCLSELVKQVRKGNASLVANIVENQTILITPITLLEISNSQLELLSDLPLILENTLTCLCTDPLAFWYADLTNFLNPEERGSNNLKLSHFNHEFVSMWYANPEKVSKMSSDNDIWKEKFIDVVKPDIGVHFDDRDLLMSIYHAVHTMCAKWFEVTVAPADCTFSNFPSFFTFYYAYWFKFIKQKNTVPLGNDFADLQNTMAAPFCRKIYLEKGFGHLLRNEVKGRRPPTTFSIAKKLYKNRKIAKTVYEEVRSAPNCRKNQTKLLPNTQIFTFAELLDELAQSS